MANERERPAKPMIRGKQVAAIVLFWIGIVFLVIGIIFGAIALAEANQPGEMERAGQMAAGFAAFSACVIGCLFILIGVILFFFGRSQVKKEKNQNIPLS